jgi:hypothetical protein
MACLKRERNTIITKENPEGGAATRRLFSFEEFDPWS